MNRSNVVQKRVLLLVALAFVGFVVYIKSLSRSVRKDIAQMQTADEQFHHSPKSEVSIQRVESHRRLLQGIYRDDASQVAPFLQQGITGNTIVDQKPVYTIAASSGAVRVMSLLLAQGTDVNTRDRSGATLLMIAAGKAKLALVDFLLAHGANVKATDKAGNTALHLAVEMAPISGGVIVDNEISRAYGITRDKRHKEKRDRLAVVQKLIQKGVDVNTRNSYGSVPLMAAVGSGHSAMVDFLLAHGADVNAANPGGATALCYAAAYNQLAMVQTLIERGASVNIQPRLYASSPMESAVRHSNVDMLRLLLAHGSDPNEQVQSYAQVKSHESLLHFARGFKDHQGNAAIVATLIQAGAK